MLLRLFDFLRRFADFLLGADFLLDARRRLFGAMMGKFKFFLYGSPRGKHNQSQSTHNSQTNAHDTTHKVLFGDTTRHRNTLRKIDIRHRAIFQFVCHKTHFTQQTTVSNPVPPHSYNYYGVNSAPSSHHCKSSNSFDGGRRQHHTTTALATMFRMLTNFSTRMTTTRRKHHTPNPAQ